MATRKGWKSSETAGFDDLKRLPSLIPVHSAPPGRFEFQGFTRNEVFRLSFLPFNLLSINVFQRSNHNHLRSSVFSGALRSARLGYEWSFFDLDEYQVKADWHDGGLCRFSFVSGVAHLKKRFELQPEDQANELTGLQRAALNVLLANTGGEDEKLVLLTDPFRVLSGADTIYSSDLTDVLGSCTSLLPRIAYSREVDGTVLYGIPEIRVVPKDGIEMLRAHALLKRDLSRANYAKIKDLARTYSASQFSGS